MYLPGLRAHRLLRRDLGRDLIVAVRLVCHVIVLLAVLDDPSGAAASVPSLSMSPEPEEDGTAVRAAAAAVAGRLAVAAVEVGATSSFHRRPGHIPSRMTTRQGKLLRPCSGRPRAFPAAPGPAPGTRGQDPGRAGHAAATGARADHTSPTAPCRSELLPTATDSAMGRHWRSSPAFPRFRVRSRPQAAGRRPNSHCHWPYRRGRRNRDRARRAGRRSVGRRVGAITAGDRERDGFCPYRLLGGMWLFLGCAAVGWCVGCVGLLG
jgi:hypothetical protein